MDVGITRRSTLLGLASSLSSVASAHAQQPPRPTKPPNPLLVNNVSIFDGSAGQLKPGNILISDRKIRQISSGAIIAPPDSTVIDGRGRVLMPGLTDAHWHMAMAPNTMEGLQQVDTGLMYANIVAEAQRTLMRGFTTIRDMGGPTFGIKAANDAGTIPGPRVYPSGAFISQTSGHGDLAPPYARPPTLGGQRSRFEEIGAFAVVNGVPEVSAAVRQQLRKGASQIKIAVGGGVFTDFDPIDTLQFTTEEIRAAVEVANDWGTYVAAHIYGLGGIRRALEAGVKSIEHGQAADEAAVRLIGEKGAWLSLQPFEPGDNPMTPEQ
jgi:imidazolonepropionase-like amidohydrolase